MKRKQFGFSLIELLIVVAIILAIAAIAIPNLLKARLRATEASAANSLRSVATSQISYKIYKDRYATGLDELGPNGYGLLTSAIGSAPYEQNGYKFATTGAYDSFTATAEPLSDTQGLKKFCTNTPAVIYFENTAPCDPAKSPPIQ